jgi:hypothetical protein
VTDDGWRCDPLPEPVDWKERCKELQRVNNKHVAAKHAAEGEKAKAEQAMRELARDRDHWKQRAHVAEAALKSLGNK